MIEAIIAGDSVQEWANHGKAAWPALSITARWTLVHWAVWI